MGFFRELLGKTPDIVQLRGRAIVKKDIGAVYKLIKAAGNTNKDIHYEACRELAFIYYAFCGDDVHVLRNELLSGILSSNEYIAQGFAEALISYGGFLPKNNSDLKHALVKVGYPAVTAILAKEPLRSGKRWHDYIDYASIRALGSIGDPRAIEPLVEFLKTQSDYSNIDNELHILAAASLCELGKQIAVEKLLNEEIIESKSFNSRSLTVNIMKQIGIKPKSKNGKIRYFFSIWEDGLHEPGYEKRISDNEKKSSFNALKNYSRDDIFRALGISNTANVSRSLELFLKEFDASTDA